MQLKATSLRTNLYTINKNGLQTNTSKTDDITFRDGEHIQQSSRRLILNLTWSEPHPQVLDINFTLTILKCTNKVIIQ